VAGIATGKTLKASLPLNLPLDQMKFNKKQAMMAWPSNMRRFNI
jgi:hypothetical protein